VSFQCVSIARPAPAREGPAQRLLSRAGGDRGPIVQGGKARSPGWPPSTRRSCAANRPLTGRARRGPPPRPSARRRGAPGPAGSLPGRYGGRAAGPARPVAAKTARCGWAGPVLWGAARAGRCECGPPPSAGDRGGGHNKTAARSGDRGSVSARSGRSGAPGRSREVVGAIARAGLGWCAPGRAQPERFAVKGGLVDGGRGCVGATPAAWRQA
jgi:hypothetical protein